MSRSGIIFQVNSGGLSGTPGSFVTQTASSSLAAATSRDVEFTVPFGQIWVIAFVIAMTTASASAATYSYGRKVNGTISALSEDSVVYSTNAISTQVITPFAPIGPGTYNINVLNGGQPIGTLGVLAQRVQ